MIASVEGLVNRVLALDEQALEKLAKLDARVIAIEVQGVDVTLFFVPRSDGLGISSELEGKADATVAGTPSALLGLMLNDGNSDALFSGEVTISGNPHLVSDFHAILKALDIDWEEQVSQITGDVLARKLGVAARHVLHWGRELGEVMREDTADYLREETETVPYSDDIESFLSGVDTLRSDVDRLAQRIDRLRRGRSS